MISTPNANETLISNIKERKRLLIFEGLFGKSTILPFFPIFRCFELGQNLSEKRLLRNSHKTVHFFRDHFFVNFISELSVFWLAKFYIWCKTELNSKHVKKNSQACCDRIFIQEVFPSEPMEIIYRTTDLIPPRFRRLSNKAQVLLCRHRLRWNFGSYK